MTEIETLTERITGLEARLTKGVAWLESNRHDPRWPEQIALWERLEEEYRAFSDRLMDIQPKVQAGLEIAA